MNSRKKIKLSETLSNAERADIDFHRCSYGCESRRDRADQARAKADKPTLASPTRKLRPSWRMTSRSKLKKEQFIEAKPSRGSFARKTVCADAGTQDAASDDSSIHTTGNS